MSSGRGGVWSGIGRGAVRWVDEKVGGGWMGRWVVGISIDKRAVRLQGGSRFEVGGRGDVRWVD